ncbi:melanoma-associated antigen 8-like [Octodon degus]|uniref:Melanoma-associated antigen 8-like n=1 Tax=Octodon degus TaxID=10160 RepID=A0A6P3FW62_OCTDE|nr:melanoma-associated antigen 8-like [Octodon degus]
MSGSPKPCQLEEAPEDQSETQGLMGREVSVLYSRKSSLSLPVLVILLILIFLLFSDLDAVKEVSAAGMLDPPQCPEAASSSSSDMAAAPLSQSPGDSSIEQEKSSFPLPALPDTKSLLIDVLNDKVAELMEFLSFKYLLKEPTSIAEMQTLVIKEYAQYFFVIFREACKCMQSVFGIDIREMHPSSPYYVLSPSLDLTYDGMVADEQNYPRTIVLIIILGAIHVQGSHASEEHIWSVLSGMGLFPGRSHCIYGEPKKFLTEDLVREQYLTYREVPNSDPPQYEFLWGPRAHAETSVEKVLEFLGQLKDTTLEVLSVCNEEGSGDEQVQDPHSMPKEER